MPASIKWSRWIDPLEPLVRESREPDEDEDNPQFQKARESFGHRKRMRTTPKNGGPAIVGPMGIVPMHESNIPSALYCFWMADTNFTVSNRFAYDLERIPGVETLDIFTRYRFRLGIGRTFDEASVMASIDEMLVRSPSSPAQQKSGVAGTTEKILAKAYPAWAIATMADGNGRSFGGSTPGAVLSQIDALPERPVSIVTSWEKK